MEKSPSFSDFEDEGVLKPVAAVARIVIGHLASLGISSEARLSNGSVLVLVDEDYELSLTEFHTVTEDYTEHGVVISFNEDEQIIRIKPFQN